MNPQIISETSIDMTELSSEIEKIKKRDETPSFRVTKTEEYLAAFVNIKKSDGEELFEKLVKLEIPRLKEPQLKKIIDVMPQSANELKVVLQGYAVTVSNDNIKKIVDLVKSYSKEKN